MMRIVIVFSVLIVGLLPLSFSKVEATSDTATDIVRNTVSQMLERVRSEKQKLTEHPEQIYDLVDELVIPHFDFIKMSRWVLGKGWHEASDEQRLQFSDEFRALLVRSYGKALLEYSEQEIRYLGELKGDKSNLILVRTEIGQAGANPVSIDYRMYKGEESDWKVIDVSVDGVSLVSTYRGEFAHHIHKNGMESLIAELAKRNSKPTKP